MLAAIAGFVTFNKSTAAAPANTPAEAEVSGTRPCTFVECGRGECDTYLVPFLCLDPLTAFYGCSAVSFIFFSFLTYNFSALHVFPLDTRLFSDALPTFLVPKDGLGRLLLGLVQHG